MLHPGSMMVRSLCVAALMLLVVRRTSAQGRHQADPPHRIAFGETEARSFTSDDSRMSGGKYRAAWSLSLEAWRFNNGVLDLPLDVRADFPFELALYKWNRLSHSHTGSELLRLPAAGGRDQAGNAMRQTTVALKTPGEYVLLVTSADSNPEGSYRLGIGVPAVPPPVAEAPTDNPPKPIHATGLYFRNLALSSTQARFAEHVAVIPTMTDLPHGGSCDWHPTSVAVDGSLPGGLKLRPGATVIEGSPRQIGTWIFTYKLRGIHCAGDAEDYGDRSVTVSFLVRP
ncbi:MAG TPA: hypothetical protein VM166_15520 [Gemmatimonadaceae bacterium]|nr:hypothetical protein [Gemmatimonadaceae bacterium]